MSDLKRKASSEVDASEEPNVKRPRSSQDQDTMDHEQIINSTAAWNLTEEATVDDASPNESVSGQDIQAHDVPAQVTPAQVKSSQHLEAQGMPSQDVPAQVVAALNTERREPKPTRKSVEPDSEKSARQLRIESLVDPGQNVRERGTVRNVDGDLRWEASDGILVPCVYHNSIRAELIAEASQNGTLGYDVPRRQGNLDFNATDITAYHPEQKTWSEERSLWPRIRDNILNRLERKQYKELYAGRDPGKMMHNGRLVVDHDNHPVYTFPDLPATISSAVEGWWLEAITRLDSRIDRMDIRARLPAFRGKTDVKKESKLYGLSAIGNKRLRFREREGLIAWDSRNGSNLINEYHKSRLPAGCVGRNTTEGGGPLSPAEVKQLDDIKKGKAEPADKAKGSKNAKRESPSLDDAPGPSSAQNFGYDGPASEVQASTPAPSVPPRGQQPQDGPPPFGAPGAQTPGFAPQITLDQPSNGNTSADISIPRGLTPAQVLCRYQFLSNLTGQANNDFQAAIEATNDEENTFKSLRVGNNNRGQRNGHGTGRINESDAFQQGSNLQPMTRADEHADDAFSQPQNVQRLSDANSSRKNIIDLRSPSPSAGQSTSAAAASGYLPSQHQSIKKMHNTVGDEDWVPEEEIDEAFWEETMNKDWPSAGGQGNDPPNREDARPGNNNNYGENAEESEVQTTLFNSLVGTSQLEATQPGTDGDHASPGPLFHDSACKDDVERSQQAVQLEPIQPGSELLQLSRNPEFDPFAPEDDDVVPTQQNLQAEAPQSSAGETQSSSDPLFDDFFAGLSPELTHEAIQEMGESLGLSGNIADYRSLLDQGLPEQPAAPVETAVTGSKRKTVDHDPRDGNKKVRSQQNPPTYTPYQPRQDQPRVRMQHPRPGQSQQPLPAHVSSAPARENPATPRSSTLMPPPRHRPRPGYQPSLPRPGGNTLPTPSVTPEHSSTPQPTRSKPPQRHKPLPSYQSPIARISAPNIIPPNASSTPTNRAPATTPHPTSSQPRLPPAAEIDHRYTSPSTPEQMALIITLLEPTIAQFQGLLRGTPFADHVVHTDMAASYMHQYQHIMRELEALWRRMNWDRSALPRLRIVGPIDRARWEGR